MTRTPISKLFDATERFKLGRIDPESKEAAPFQSSHEIIGIYNHLGKLVAVMNEDHLYDEHGNNFEADE